MPGLIVSTTVPTELISSILKFPVVSTAIHSTWFVSLAAQMFTREGSVTRIPATVNG